MQLAHLIPHIDAEIHRLQKARDLLAWLPPSADTYSTRGHSKAEREMLFPSRLLIEKELPQGIPEPVMLSADKLEPAVAPPAARKARRITSLRSSVRPESRKRVVAVDTALSRPVPSGPVFISAEEVRKAQALKTAQASKAAEVKKAGADLISTFGWRNRASDARSVDALLQRLIHIGEEDTDRVSGNQISSFGQN